MINKVVLVSGVQQSDSVIHVHISILFQVLFPFRLLQSTEQSSLCYTVGPCWLAVLSMSIDTDNRFINTREITENSFFSLLYCLTQNVGTGVIKMFWLGSQAEDMNSQSLQTSLLFHFSPVSLPQDIIIFGKMGFNST